MVIAAEQIAIAHDGLSTIGRVASDAVQSSNVIFDDVVFHLDIRHHEDDKLSELESDIRDKFKAISEEAKGVEIIRWEKITDIKALNFDPKAVSCVREACSGFPKHELVSGAGHDLCV